MLFSSQLLSSAFAFLLERWLGFRTVIFLSSLVLALSVFLSAFAPNMLMLALTFGLIHGAASGILFHSVICVLLQHFPTGCTRATATMLLGSTVGVLIYSQLLDLTLSTLGWEASLMILGALAVLPGLPVSLLIIPVSAPYPPNNQPHEAHLTMTTLRKVSMGFTRRYTARQKHPAPRLPTIERSDPRKVDGERIANYSPASEVFLPSTGGGGDWQEEYTPWKELASLDPHSGGEGKLGGRDSPSTSSSTSSGYESGSSLSVAPREEEGSSHETTAPPTRKRKHSMPRLPSPSWCGDFRVIMRMGRMWIFSIAMVLGAMAWCVFILNIGSFFDSVGLALNEVAFLLMIMAAAEIGGKLYLATVGESVPVAKIHFLIGQSVIMTTVSVILIYAQNYVAMIFLSVVIGFMRALWMTLPYTVSVEVMGSKYADQAVTMTLFCQGVGNLLGNFPAGAIFDATGSYQLVFAMVTACLFLATVLYSAVPCLSRDGFSLLPKFRRLPRRRFKVVSTDISSEIATQTDLYIDVEPI